MGPRACRNSRPRRTAPRSRRTAPRSGRSSSTPASTCSAGRAPARSAGSSSRRLPSQEERRLPRRTEAPVRNRALHDQLRLFTGQAAERLQAILAAGSEIPFEVTEAPGARSVLYRYTPLSGEFLRERFGELRALEGFAATVSALARLEGTSGYLRVLGTSYVPAFDHDRAEAALVAFLCRLWEESSTFALDDPGFA